MDLFEALEKRRAVRAFSTRPVPRDLIDRLMRAASLAPSSMNEQPWRFYVATGQSRQVVTEILTRNTVHVEEYLRLSGKAMEEGATRWFAELGDAPVVIACTMPKTDDEFARLNKQLSLGCALENLMLAATDVGLGTCPITFAYWVRDDLARALGVPEDRTVVCLMALGFPASEPEPTERESDVAVYRD